MRQTQRGREKDGKSWDASSHDQGLILPQRSSNGVLSQEKQEVQVTSSRVIQFTESKLPGCFVVQLPIFHDDRGHFVKTIQRSAFEAHGLEADFKECFYSTSHKDVLRGMHFQLPDSDHAKLVYCTAGSIYDVTLDLRVGSPTYGQHEIYEVSSHASNAVYLPRGVAHGFFVREAPAVTVYHVTSEHTPALDAGIRWDSFGAAWPVEEPIVSQRDRGLPSFTEFDSPFRYGET